MNALPSPAAIYSGRVVHRRLRPKGHLLRYRVFTLLLDLDRLDETASAISLLGIDRPGLVSFRRRDHGDGSGDLRGWVDRRLRDAGIDPAGIRVEMLCYPRILGYVFNPITVYFCRHPNGAMAAILYQVDNTMGERHTYIIPVLPGDTPPFRQSCDKAMYVSPFTPMESRYRFSIVPPTDEVCIGIRQEGDEGPILNASFTGARAPLSNRTLLAALLRNPLMTLKIIGGIHYEAFRLWRKGIPVFRHVPQPAGDISVIAAEDAKGSTR